MSEIILPENVDRLELHPLRTWMLWPDYAAAMNRIGSGMGLYPKSTDLEQTAEIVRKLHNTEIMKVPFEERPKGNFHFFQLIELGLRFAFLYSKGMNIYTLSPNLRKAIGRTQLGDIRLGDLKPPYPAFYIGFESGSNIYFGTEDNPTAWIVDGAYVKANSPLKPDEDHTWDICLTCRDRIGPLKPGYLDHWALHPEPHFTFHLKGSSEATFDEALGEALESGNLDLEPDDTAAEKFREAVASVQDLTSYYGVELSTPIVSSREMLAQFKTYNFGHARKALALVLGGICALTSKPELRDAETEWPEGAPTDLIQESVHGKTPKARQKAAGAIKRQGFTPIRRLDLSAFGAPTESGVSAGSGRTVRPHWRAGHFRRQHHGKGRSLVAVRWIMPTMVNAGQGPMSEGRLYQVTKTKDEQART